MEQDGIAGLGTILGVWAHPDDEAYLSGGLMAAAVAAGQRVVCVTATRGEAGFPDLERPEAERRALRERELAACLDLLGVTEHHWLDERDGACHEVDPARPVARLVELIGSVRPDTVLTFGPDGMTAHLDHIAVGHWTTLAALEAGLDPARLWYATKTAEWNERFLALMGATVSDVMMDDAAELPATDRADLVWYERLDDELAERKTRALRCQASQIEPLVAHVGEEPFVDLTREEFFRAAPLPLPAVL